MVGLRQHVIVCDGWQHAESGHSNCGVEHKPPDGRVIPGLWDRVKPNGSGRQLDSLVRTIEGEIIPRLMLAHRIAPGSPSPPAVDARMPGPDDVAELARLVLAYDTAVAFSYVEAMRGQGVSLETLFTDLLAPTARHLGELWQEDLCDFTGVTVGLCLLHQVLRELSPGFRNEAGSRERGGQLVTERSAPRRVLLVPVPGEQHSFGLLMVMEYFRRAGWEVWNEFPASSDELAAMVRNEWFDVVGLSASCERRLDLLTANIRSIRRVSCNRAVGVMAGGQLFSESPELLTLVGADATAGDGRQAVSKAEDLLVFLASCC